MTLADLEQYTATRLCQATLQAKSSTKGRHSVCRCPFGNSPFCEHVEFYSSDGPVRSWWGAAVW